MITKTPIYHLTIASLVGLCVSCSSGSPESPTPAVTDPQVSDDPIDIAVQDRLLDTSANTTNMLEIDTCFCESRYTDTTKIYNFTDQQAVLVLTFDNEDIAFTHSTKLYFFQTETAAESISRWINNLYSDALFPTNARTIAEYSLTDDSVTITSRALLEPTDEFSADNYESYQVEFSVDNQSQGSEYTLTGFSDTVTVHLQADSQTVDL